MLAAGHHFPCTPTRAAPAGAQIWDCCAGLAPVLHEPASGYLQGQCRLREPGVPRREHLGTDERLRRRGGARRGAQLTRAGEGAKVATEDRLRTVLLTVAALAVPPLLLFLYYRLMFIGLINGDALDFAQARTMEGLD